jgi:hypothetical protein
MKDNSLYKLGAFFALAVVPAIAKAYPGANIFVGGIGAAFTLIWYAWMGLFSCRVGS